MTRDDEREIRVAWHDKTFIASPAAGAGFDEPFTVTVDFRAKED